MLGCLYLLLFTWTSDSPDARMFPIANHARPRSLSSCTRRILSSSNQFPKLWLLRQLIMMMVMMMMTTFKTPSSSSSVFLFSSIIQSFTAVREESSFGCSFVSFFWPSTVWNYWASDDHHDYLIVSVCLSTGPFLATTRIGASECSLDRSEVICRQWDATRYCLSRPRLNLLLPCWHRGHTYALPFLANEHSITNNGVRCGRWVAAERAEEVIALTTAVVCRHSRSSPRVAVLSHSFILSLSLPNFHSLHSLTNRLTKQH